MGLTQCKDQAPSTSWLFPQWPLLFDLLLVLPPMWTAQAKEYAQKDWEFLPLPCYACWSFSPSFLVLSKWPWAINLGWQFYPVIIDYATQYLFCSSPYKMLPLKALCMLFCKFIYMWISCHTKLPCSFSSWWQTCVGCCRCISTKSGYIEMELPMFPFRRYPRQKPCFLHLSFH